LKHSFIKANKDALEGIKGETRDIAVIAGFVDGFGTDIYTAAALLHHGCVMGVQHKMHLPNYDVFDEKRYFKPARENHVFELDELKLGINICEDIWVDNGPTDVQAKKGADFIVNISASPFYAGKGRERRELIARRARENSLPIVYVNLVGGQDDLVFDGGSFVFNKNGALIAKGKRFEEELVLTKLDGPAIIPEKEDTLQEIYNALVLGIRDYVRKNGFEKVVIGLSGGIDSALTATLATGALGSQNVIGVSMPSSITSQSSKEDAKRIAENLGIEFKVIPIVDAVATYTAMLQRYSKAQSQT
jgi:NAD+ synthase (glutamine-hydrolysing)